MPNQLARNGNHRNNSAGSASRAPKHYVSNAVAELICETGIGINDLSELLQVSTRSIQRWIQKEEMPEAARLVFVSLRDRLPVKHHKAWRGWAFRNEFLVMPTGVSFRIGELITYDYLKSCGLLDVPVLVKAQEAMRESQIAKFASQSNSKITPLTVVK